MPIPVHSITVTGSSSTTRESITHFQANALSFAITLASGETFNGQDVVTMELREIGVSGNDGLLATVSSAANPTGSTMTLAFTTAQTNQPIAGDAKDFDLVLYGIDGTELEVIWIGRITLVAHGASLSAGSPPDVSGIFLTTAQADALYATIANLALKAPLASPALTGAGTFATLMGSSLSVDTELTIQAATTVENNSTDFIYGTGAAAAHRTALGLGTLATQSGTFSGSGTLATGGFTLTVPATGTAALAGTYSNSALNATTIGATTPGTGAFTTVTASGELTLGTSGILNGGTNLIEQRNLANAQTLRIYNTYTDASNYERATFGYTSNILRIGTENAGTGTARAINFVIGGTATWEHSAAGHFRPLIDNTYDIGASGATRPRNVFVAGNGTFGGTLTTSVAGAASTPAVSVTGAPYTAGSATTNYPLIYANGGTAPTTWSTAGTYFGINAVSGFAGNLIDLRVNGGASVFKVSNSGVVTCTSVTASGVFVATPNTLTGAGAISVSTTSTGYISTGAAQALTLADGVNGQIKTIIHTSDGGSGVLTPTTKAGYTTITFANVGDSVTLQFITGTGWCITGIFGAVAA